MCRFLLAQFRQPTKPEFLLTKFAKMAQKSKALDGDWQGDGWGVVWLDENREWKLQKSLAPVWEEVRLFKSIPKTSMFIVHARSASFPQHKGIVEFNQPYINKKYVFVFNGLLRGVSLPNVPGKIGAEKIWYLLQTELQKNAPQLALEKVKNQLITHAKEIVALNIGLATKKRIYSLNYFTKHPQYYTLHKWVENDVKVICSEQL